MWTFKWSKIYPGIEVPKSVSTIWDKDQVTWQHPERDTFKKVLYHNCYDIEDFDFAKCYSLWKQKRAKPKRLNYNKEWQYSRYNWEHTFGWPLWFRGRLHDALITSRYTNWICYAPVCASMKTNTDCFIFVHAWYTTSKLLANQKQDLGLHLSPYLLRCIFIQAFSNWLRCGITTRVNIQL